MSPRKPLTSEKPPKIRMKTLAQGKGIELVLESLVTGVPAPEQGF